jgi:hypothetical protein
MYNYTGIRLKLELEKNTIFFVVFRIGANSLLAPRQNTQSEWLPPIPLQSRRSSLCVA